MDAEVISETKCGICQKEFSKASYCKKHVKNVHFKPEKTGTKVFECALCEKTFAQKWGLKRHYNSVHADDIEKFKCSLCTFVTVHKANLRRHCFKQHRNNSSIANSLKLKCSKCKAQFQHKGNLRYHERKVHKIGQLSVEVKRKCPLCSFTAIGQKRQTIRDHFKKAHKTVLKIETRTFPDLEEFLAWKSDVERKTNSVYLKTRYSYRCHRSGLFKPRGKNIRRLKTIGSCKINGYCPAVIDLRKCNDGTLEASFVSTHVGHKNELKHIHLSKVERGKIAIQLASKKPRQEILKDIRMSISNQDLQRIHLINRKDIINIEKSFNLIEESEKHPFDLISIDDWVNHSQGDETTDSLEEPIQGEVGSLNRESKSSFEHEKRKLLKEFEEIVNKLKTVEDIRFLKNNLKSIPPILQAMNTERLNVQVI